MAYYEYSPGGQDRTTALPDHSQLIEHVHALGCMRVDLGHDIARCAVHLCTVTVTAKINLLRMPNLDLQVDDKLTWPY